MVMNVDFALFMERYGYKILLVVLLGGTLVGLLALMGYNLVAWGAFTGEEAAFIVGLLIAASIAAAFAGRFMNTALSVLSRVSYHNRAKLFEDEKKIEREREKLREEGGELY
jgi:hypothetical protein